MANEHKIWGKKEQFSRLIPPFIFLQAPSQFRHPQFFHHCPIWPTIILCGHWHHPQRHRQLAKNDQNQWHNWMDWQWQKDNVKRRIDWSTNKIVIGIRKQNKIHRIPFFPQIIFPFYISFPKSFLTQNRL